MHGVACGCVGACMRESNTWAVARAVAQHGSPVCQEEGLRAALLLEQAALCLLRVAPPALRKFAFHMVLVGLRYASCGQGALGARAYR